jgi:ribosomal protein S19
VRSTSNAAASWSLDWRYRVGAAAAGDRASRGPIKVQRSGLIQESRVGQELLVHNGRTWSPLRVSNDRVGFRVGEFAATTAWGQERKAGGKAHIGGKPAKSSVSKAGGSGQGAGQAKSTGGGKGSAAAGRT